MVKNRLDGKSYLVILRQALFNPNSNKTLLVEYQIEYNGVKLFFVQGSLVEINYLDPGTRWGVLLNWVYPRMDPPDTSIFCPQLGLMSSA